MGKFFLMLWSVVFLNGIIESSATYRHNPYANSVLRATTPVTEEQKEPVVMHMSQQLLPDFHMLVPMSQLARLQAVAEHGKILFQENLQLASENRTLKLEHEKFQEEIQGRAKTYAELQKICDEMVKVANGFEPVYEENERLKRENSILQQEVLRLHGLLAHYKSFQGHAWEKTLLV